jgi:hypothetical protein
MKKITKWLKGFLFGRDPNIFDENGQVVHKIPRPVWKKWEDRYKQNNWRVHSGMKNHTHSNSNNK